MKLNCWEHKKCGRQPDGKNVAELGVCPASAEKKFNDINGGKNGGRICWALAGTLCEGKIQGTFAKKIGDCKRCDFYKKAQSEEGDDFVATI